MEFIIKPLILILYNSIKSPSGGSQKKLSKWQHTPPRLRRLRQEDSEFKVNLGYISKTLSQKKKRLTY
jgi:hypothetical protein